MPDAVLCVIIANRRFVQTRLCLLRRLQTEAYEIISGVRSALRRSVCSVNLYTQIINIRPERGKAVSITRITAITLALVLLLTALCGCGKDKAVIVTLRTVSTLGDAEEYTAYSSLIAEFSTEYPDIYIRDTTTAAADAYRLNASDAETYTASNAPHVVYCSSEDVMPAVSEYFVSVDEIRSVYPDFASNIDSRLLESLRLADGQVYCVPVLGEWTAIVVNESLLNKYSVDAPTDWNMLLDTVFQLSAQGILPFANAADDAAAMLEALVIAYGGSECASLGLEGYSNIISSYWLPAFSDFAQLCRSGAFAPAALTPDIGQELLSSAPEAAVTSSSDIGSEGETLSGSDLLFGHSFSDFPEAYDNILGSDRDRSVRTDAISLFNSGLAAMIMLDSSELSLIDSVNSCKVIPFPSPLDNGSVLTGGCTSGFAITRRAFNDPNIREAAVSFVEHMTSAAAAEKFAALGYLPSVSSDSISCTGAVGSLLENSGAAQLAPTTRSGSSTVAWNSIGRMCARLYYQLTTPEEICNQLSDPQLVWVGQSDADGDASSDLVSPSDA